jgi:hypothetical protein
VWSRKDGDDPPTDRDLLVDGFDEIIQRWENKKPVETLILSLDGPLPNVDAMNAAIPKEQWEKIGSGGELSAPCQHSAVIYVVDPVTAESYTIANSTWGMWICYEDIVDRIKTMCRLRGGMVKPIVRLSRRKMKTTHGVKQRPHLEVVRWVKFGNPTEAVTPPTQPALPAPSTQPATPVLEAKPATQAPATPPAKVAPSPPVDFGEPVEPVTLGEEMNDEIPF